MFNPNAPASAFGPMSAQMANATSAKPAKPKRSKGIDWKGRAQSAAVAAKQWEVEHHKLFEIFTTMAQDELSWCREMASTRDSANASHWHAHMGDVFRRHADAAMEAVAVDFTMFHRADANGTQVPFANIPTHADCEQHIRAMYQQGGTTPTDEQVRVGVQSLLEQHRGAVRQEVYDFLKKSIDSMDRRDEYMNTLGRHITKLNAVKSLPMSSHANDPKVVGRLGQIEFMLSVMNHVLRVDLAEWSLKDIPKASTHGGGDKASGNMQAMAAMLDQGGQGMVTMSR